jgi:hypothetical protein
MVPVAQESTVKEAGLDQSSSSSAERSFEDLYSDTVELEQALSARTITLEKRLIQIATAQTVIAQRATKFAQARDALGELQQLLVEAQEKVIAYSMAYQDAVKVHHERTGDARGCRQLLRGMRNQETAVQSNRHSRLQLKIKPPIHTASFIVCIHIII